MKAFLQKDVVIAATLKAWPRQRCHKQALIFGKAPWIDKCVLLNASESQILTYIE